MAMEVAYRDTTAGSQSIVTLGNPLPVAGTISFVSGTGDDTTTTSVTEETPLPVETVGAFVVTQEEALAGIWAELRKIRHGLEIEYETEFLDPNA